MSRAYRISTSQSTRKHVRIEDGVQTQLEMLQVLSASEMIELLAAELEAEGFERDGQVMRKVEDDVGIEVDLETGTVSARLAVEADLDLKVQVTQRATQSGGTAQERQKLAETAEQQLAAQEQSRTRALTAEVTERLEKTLTDVRARLDRATNRATAEALKIRARQLGEVQEVTEDPETGELTIRVKV